MSGSNILCGTDYTDIIDSFKNFLKKGNEWEVPLDYCVKNVSDVVINILLGKK